jgi:hypothetical protein
MVEEFKKHKSGYLVSNFGRIKGKSVEYLKLTLTSSGYQMIRIGLVHRVVYETFKGEIEEGHEINHIDNKKTNNNINNLESITKSENQKHKYKNMKNKIDGENNPMSFLKEVDVLDIYEMIKSGKNNIEIADKYNIHDRYVSLIRSGKRWNKLFKIHLNNNIKSLGCNSLPKDSILDVINMIVNTDMTNVEIADKYFLDKTTISKVRNKRIWNRGWKLYYSEMIATTIESTNEN